MPKDLLERFRKGDTDAFEFLVNEFAPRLKGFFLRLGAQNATAEDLVQHVFLKLYKNKNNYSAKGRVDAFIFQVARNVFIDYRRRRQNISLDEEWDAEDSSPFGAGEVEEKDRNSLLRKIVSEQELEVKELLELAVMQKLPYEKVGEILGIPAGTVKSRVFYTLRRLRSEYKDLERELF